MRIFIVVLLSALSAACATPGSERSGTASTKEGIAAATQAWRAAYDSRDPQKITGQYAKDAVFWGTSSKTVRATPEAIMEYFVDAKKRPDARVEIIEQHIQIYGDVAINTGL